MNMKTAIIIGVIIVLIPMIIAPFFISKNNNNDNSQNIVGEISGDIEEKSGDLSGDTESFKDNIKVEIVTNQNNSGEVILDNPISENIESITNETELKNENDIEVNSSIPGKTTESNTKPAEIKKEEPVIIEVEQNVEVQAPVQQEAVVNDVEIPVEAIGVLKIDKIGLFQPVMEGHSLEVLKTNLGHVDGSAYWIGNIGILGHNNGNAGFFKRLTELKIDDVIEYITDEGTKTYKVSEIVEIEDTDWSRFASTKDNRITLVTCVKNVPTKRYCVQAIEI